MAGYAYTTGGLSFDPSVRVTNAALDTSNVGLAYARSLDLAGMSAKFDAILPYTWLSGTAERTGQPVDHSVTGLEGQIPPVDELS